MDKPTLRRVVKVNHPDGRSKEFKPGDTPTPEWGRLIRNAKAWGGTAPDWDAIEASKPKRKPRKKTAKKTAAKKTTRKKTAAKKKA